MRDATGACSPAPAQIASGTHASPGESDAAVGERTTLAAGPVDFCEPFATVWRPDDARDAGSAGNFGGVADV